MKKATRRKVRFAARVFRPTTAEEYLALSEKDRARWGAVTDAISKMRTEGYSASRSSREAGIPRRAFILLARSALKKNSSGRYVAKPKDRLLRVLVIPSKSGLLEIATADSREASVLAKYWTAVHKYLATGDEAALKRIRRSTIVDAQGKRVRLIKDLNELERLGSAGEFRFESIYARAT